MESINSDKLEIIYHNHNLTQLYRYNFTITFDHKRWNLSEAWNQTKQLNKLSEYYRLYDGRNRIISEVISVELFKSKNNHYPHFHGQVTYLKALNRDDINNINTRLRNAFGRCNFIRNIEEHDDIPSFIEKGNSRDWLEYILKDVLKTQETVKEYPVLYAWKTYDYYNN